MRFICLALFFLMAAPSGVRAVPFDTAAQAAILIDHRTGDVLYEKNPDEPLPPASMSKLMTAFMVFERIHEGSLALEDALPVSEKAWRMGGSKMFVEVESRVRVEDLLKGIIVQSGNDACVVVAEALAGSEDAFADQMNVRALELGLTNSNFTNATGWPDPMHRMSVRDLARLAGMIIDKYPQFYEFYSVKEFEFNEINQQNRNPLLRRGVPGVDGMKTGYTQESGYGLVASAERDGRRLIMVVAGLETPRERSIEAEQLLEYGFREFQEYRIFDAGELISEATVWLGNVPKVKLIAGGNAYVTLSREARQSMQVKVIFEEPIAAPIQNGQVVGRVEISADTIDPLTVPVVAGEDITQAGPLDRALGALNFLIFGTG